MDRAAPLLQRRVPDNTQTQQRAFGQLGAAPVMAQRVLDPVLEFRGVDGVVLDDLHRRRPGVLGGILQPVQAVYAGQDAGEGVKDVLLEVAVLERLLGPADEQRGDLLLIGGQVRCHGPGFDAQDAQPDLAILAVKRHQPEAIARGKAVAFDLIGDGHGQGGQVVIVQEALHHVLVPAAGFQAMPAAGEDGDKGRPHLQQVAERRQGVLQKGAQVGRGEQAPVDGLYPGDLLPVLAVDGAIDEGLGPVDDQLQKHDDADDGKDEHRVAGQAQDLLDLGDGEHGKDHSRSHQRPAHQVVDEIVLDDTIGGQGAEIGHAVGHEHDHQQDADVAHKEQELEAVGRQGQRHGGDDQIGEDAQGRGHKGQAQIGHAPARGAGQTALPGTPDVERTPDDRNHKVAGKDPEQRARGQVGGLGAVDPVVDQEVGEENHAQKGKADQIGKDHCNPAPARTQVGGAEQRVGEMKVGCRHQGDADPLEFEQELGAGFALDLVEHDVAGVDDEHHGQEGTECCGHRATVVVGEEVDEQGEGGQNDGGGQNLVDENEPSRQPDCQITHRKSTPHLHVLVHRHPTLLTAPPHWCRFAQRSICTKKSAISRLA